MQDYSLTAQGFRLCCDCFFTKCRRIAEIELTDETRCASSALDTSLVNSLDHKLVVMILSRDTQCVYMLITWSTASESIPPINTRSGAFKSSMAVPSARNSGLETIRNLSPRSLESNILLNACAVRTGNVLFLPQFYQNQHI